MIRIIRHLCWKLLLCFCGLTVYSQSNTIDSLVTVLYSAKQDSNKVKLFNDLAAKYISINNTAKARAYADSSEILASALNYKTGKANAIVLNGQAESKKGNWENAVNKYKLAANLYHELGDKTAEANTFTNIAFEYTQKDKYVEALRYRHAALKLYEELNNKDGLMTTYLGIGSVYGNMANYPEALKNLLIALKMAREAGKKNIMAGALRNLSVLYQYEKNLDASFNAAMESLKISEEMGNKRGVASAKSSLGVIYTKQEKYEEALNVFSKAMEIFRDLGDKRNMAYMYNLMAVVKTSQDKLDEALSMYHYASQLRSEVNDKWGVAESEISIGSLLSKQADLLPEKQAKIKYDSAIIYISKAAAVMKEIGYKQSEQAAYRQLSEIYVALKDYKKALEYKEMHLKIRDSVMNNETTRKLEQQRTQYEVEKAVSEEKVQKEKALAEEKIASEKKLADEKNRHELLAAKEKYQFELALADERTEQEKIRAEEQLKKEQALAEEKYKSSQVLVAAKTEQEKEKEEIKSRNEMLLMGAGMLLFALVFVFLYLRQRSLKLRAIERADTVHRMAELELQSLRAQLNPHFMFNSLNAIQELILMEDNERSHVYLSRFSKLIRMLLDNASQPFIPLRKEIEFLELYLSLENLRIPDLQYTIEIDPGIDTIHTLVPNMMLQPYIENAIWHGLSPKTSDKKLAFRIHRQNGAIDYEIEDNGIGRKKAAELKSLYRKEHKSKGMELLTKRFKLLSEEFGSEIKTVITDLSDDEHTEGTRVTISVPKVLSGYKKETIA
jgi:LytS/YehU family sensor histidine kinase/tetratricopeptide (TPR) repeat protein